MVLLSLESLERLQSLNIFKKVQLQFDTTKNNKMEETGGLEVAFVVEEFNRLSSSLSASAGTQSGDAVSH